MPRQLLAESDIHPEIRNRIANWHETVVKEATKAIAASDVVVIGMRINPFVKRARKALGTAGIPFQYLEYGSYLSMWRERTALKMWTGWPTLPMIFVKGTLIGGATDLEKLIASGELKTLLAK
ncbi:MAG: glutaredoxin [Pseudomonadota bacterium]